MSDIKNNNKNDIWINLFLFFLVTDKPETVLDLMQSDNCEEEFTDIVQRIVTMDSKQFQHTCIDWLMKHREKLMELNKVYKTNLMRLPSVTPKAESCEDCISRTDLIAAMHLIMDDAKIGDNDEDYESLDDIKEQYIEIVKGMVSVKPEIKWIPVSEKLPNRGDTVIATFRSFVTGMPFVATTHIVREPKEVVKDSNIIAWMPIMKPYKGK